MKVILLVLSLVPTLKQVFETKPKNGYEAKTITNASKCTEIGDIIDRELTQTFTSLMWFGKEK